MVGGTPGLTVETTQMLAFTGRHGIKPIVETFPMANINRTVDYVRQRKARHRAVLVAQCGDCFVLV